MSELAYKLSLEFDKRGYKDGKALGYLDAIQDLQKIERKPEFNANQQIVLEQLCLIYIKQIYKSSFQAIYIFVKSDMSDAYLNLDRKEADQVLEVFSRWAQELFQATQEDEKICRDCGYKMSECAKL